MQNITSADVANALHIPTKTIDFAIEADRRCNTISLEDIFRPDDDRLGYEEVIASENYEEKSNYSDMKIIFNEAIQQLSTEEIMLMNMYYNKDMSQKEIAEALQISQMSLSRKMKKIFNTIARLTESRNLRDN